LRIAVRNNNINSALRVLKRKTKESLVSLREKEFYEKPSTKRNKAKQAARIRELRRQRKQNNANKRR